MANFSRLPVQVKALVAEQLKFRDWMYIGQSSKVTASAFKRSRFVITSDEVKEVEIEYFKEEIRVNFLVSAFEEFGFFKASELPSIQFVDLKVSVGGTVCDSYCKQLSAFFRKVRATDTKLDFFEVEGWSCSSPAFKDLLEAADATELRRAHEIPSEFLLDLPQKIRNIDVYSPVKDDEVIQIKAADISINKGDIGNSGLNNLLKEWYDGDRTIEKISINTTQLLHMDGILDGIECEEWGIANFTLNNGHQELFWLMYSLDSIKIATEKKKLY